MANALVQQTGIAAGTAQAAVQVGFPTNVAAGNFIEVWIGTSSLTAAITLTDTLGNTYTQAGSYQSLAGVGRLSQWRAANITGGSCTITASTTAATSWVWDAAEFSGVSTSAPLEGTNGGTGTSAAPASGTVTATATDLVTAAYLSTGGLPGTIPSSPFTNLATGTGGGGLIMQIAYHLSAAGNEGCTFNQINSAGWCCTGASFLTQPASPPVAAVNIYRRSEPGPPMLGFPWSAPIPPALRPRATVPPAPPPPVTPPVSPPPPPGVPPTLPPSPPAVVVTGVELVNVDPGIERRAAQIFEVLKDWMNPLILNGSLVKTATGDVRVVVVTQGLSGTFP